MRKLLVILCLVCIYFGEINAQTVKTKQSNNKKEYKTNVELTAGFAISEEFFAVKTTLSANNLIAKRYGPYTTFEIGIGDRPSFNIWGLTASITPKVYIFGGIDFFTDQGLFRSGFSNIRKEIGLGFVVLNWGVIRAGWSFTIGPTATIGVNIKL